MSNSNNGFSNKRERLANRSPGEILRILSRFPTQQFENLPNLTREPAHHETAQKEKIEKPNLKRSYDFFAPYEKRLQELRKRPATFNVRPPINIFKKKRNRHLEDVESVLSERTFHTTTNYSGLDRLSDLDTMSVATQDLLPREEEASVDLFNMPTDRASVISDRYSQMETQRETTQPEFSHDITRELEGLNSDHFQSSISEELIGAEKEQEKSVQEDNVLPFKDDFGEDTNFGYAGIEDDILDAGGAVDMERDQSSIDMDHIPSTRITRRILSNNNFARKRIFEARSEKIKAKDDVFNRHHVKQIFTNKIAMSKNVPCHVGTFSMVADIFCDQLADDILAYKKNGEENEENEENEEENSDEITLEDIVLLMKRQRVLNDKTSLQSLIYKHLPREYWDDLITSALADNVLSEERSGLTD